jgi:hypothetical protein
MRLRLGGLNYCLIGNHINDTIIQFGIRDPNVTLTVNFRNINQISPLIDPSFSSPKQRRQHILRHDLLLQPRNGIARSDSLRSSSGRIRGGFLLLTSLVAGEDDLGDLDFRELCGEAHLWF